MDESIGDSDLVCVSVLLVVDVQVGRPQLTEDVVRERERIARRDVGQAVIPPTLAQEHVDPVLLVAIIYIYI